MQIAGEVGASAGAGQAGVEHGILAMLDAANRLHHQLKVGHELADDVVVLLAKLRATDAQSEVLLHLRGMGLERLSHLDRELGRVQGATRGVAQPKIEFVGECDDGAARAPVGAADRQPELTLVALYRADTAAKVGRDFFPGIQYDTR